VKTDSISPCFCKTSPFAPKETTWHKAVLKLAAEADKDTFVNMNLKMSLAASAHAQNKQTNIMKKFQMAYKAAKQNQSQSRHPGT
jgi:hypothetical protein